MNSLDAMSGIEFEGLITQLLELMGFHTETTKASGDGGIDIIATLDQPLTRGRYLIQCKRYSPDALVGSAKVREFYGALTADKRAVKGILVTTSGFTAQALEFAEDLPIELIERAQLELMLRENGMDLSTNGSHGELSESIQPEDRANLLLERAITLSRTDRDGEAVKLLREAAHMQPDDARIRLWLGICYSFLGLYEDQIAASREAIRLRPDYHDAWYWLGSGLSRVGELDGAIDALSRANSISPDDIYTWQALGDAHMGKNEYEQAMGAFKKALELRPEDCSSLHKVAMAKIKLKQYQQAVEIYQRAAALDPTNPSNWYALTYGYYVQGASQRMFETLRRLESMDPESARRFEAHYLDR